MNFKKLNKIALGAGFGAAALLSLPAHALPSVTTAFDSGSLNNFSDDFGEILLDNDSNGFLSTGDVLFTWAGITSFPTSGVDATSVNELTVLSAIEIADVQIVPDGVCNIAFVSPNGDCGLFEFTAPTATFAGILGTLGITVDNSEGLTFSADTVAIFLEDATPDFTNSNLSTAEDGVVRLVLDLIEENGDSWGAIGPTSLLDFFFNPIGTGIGSFGFDLTVADSGWDGWVFDEQATARGTLSRAEPTAESPVGGDASFFVTPRRVPEPASLSLMGLGLLGFAVARRRKAA